MSLSTFTAVPCRQGGSSRAVARGGMGTEAAPREGFEAMDEPAIANLPDTHDNGHVHNSKADYANPIANRLIIHSSHSDHSDHCGQSDHNGDNNHNNHSYHA